MSDPHSRPRAFRLDRPDTVTVTTEKPEIPEAVRGSARVIVTEEPDDAIDAADGVPVLPARGRRTPWAGLLFGAIGGLASLAIGLAIERLVVDLFASATWLGWLALALTALACLCLAVIAWREIRGVLRERRTETLRMRAVQALAVRDHETAREVARDLASFYALPAVPGGGPSVQDADAEIMDADDRLALAERTLLAPLDERATRAVADAAKQVSVVTALSPRALVDVAFVIYAGARLLRHVARIYAGRPGLLGSLRLARAAVNHLAVTGGAALGDGLVQQVLGHGVAARISARFGEGVLNGLMTARFGLAAIEVCRPLPFIRETPPRIGDVAGEFMSGGKAE
ncbi:YcjF family protein [uncultured Enterovirga sp.]|uniref:YcjF family protein n=1 Tax=uncultured Enterovirga sp. TaxID=2026352 RepID=UPI0035CC7579